MLAAVQTVRAEQRVRVELLLAVQQRHGQAELRPGLLPAHGAVSRSEVTGPHLSSGSSVAATCRAMAQGAALSVAPRNPAGQILESRWQARSSWRGRAGSRVATRLVKVT